MYIICTSMIKYKDSIAMFLSTEVNKMHVGRTRIFSRARLRSSNRARMNKPNFTTEKIE